MIHIAIDTSAIGKNKSINDAYYKALKRLVDADELTIHIPYIVKKEIESQEKDYYLQEYKQLKKGLRDFNRVQKPPELYEKINKIKNEVEQLDITITLDADRFSNAWVNGLNSKIWEINTSQTIAAWDAYFSGTPPFTLKKVRDDIPDSFICSSIKEIKDSVDELIVLANDIKIYDTFKDIPNIKVQKSIKDFINSKNIQEILEELDTITGQNIVQSKLENLVDFIKKYEVSTSLMEYFLQANIGEEIVGNHIYDIPLSNDADGEATISSYNEGDNVKIDLNNPIHYGKNQIGFNFQLEIEVIADYFVNKSDYYSELYSGEHTANNISIGDWNDHVFQAESDIILKVGGTVSIEIDTTNVDFSEIAKCDPDELDDYLYDLYSESVVKIETISEIEAI